MEIDQERYTKLMQRLADMDAESIQFGVAEELLLREGYSSEEIVQAGSEVSYRGIAEVLATSGTPAPVTVAAIAKQPAKKPGSLSWLQKIFLIALVELLPVIGFVVYAQFTVMPSPVFHVALLIWLVVAIGADVYLLRRISSHYYGLLGALGIVIVTSTVFAAISLSQALTYSNNIASCEQSDGTKDQLAQILKTTSPTVSKDFINNLVKDSAVSSRKTCIETIQKNLLIRKVQIKPPTN